MTPDFFLRKNNNGFRLGQHDAVVQVLFLFAQNRYLLVFSLSHPSNSLWVSLVYSAVFFVSFVCLKPGAHLSTCSREQGKCP